MALQLRELIILQKNLSSVPDTHFTPVGNPIYKGLTPFPGLRGQLHEHGIHSHKYTHTNTHIQIILKA